MKQPGLGKKILELRLSKGLTQSELADMCNLSIRTVQRIELAEVTQRSFTIKTIFSNLEYEFYNSNAESQSVKTSTLRGAILEMFNLKKNTMKKVSVLSVILILAAVVLTKNNVQGQTINGWMKGETKPKEYEIGLDNSVTKSGKKCAYLKSVDNNIDAKEYGTLMQKCNARLYLGKKIKMTGYIKAENVKASCAMWLRVDSRYNQKALGFDNMDDRPIRGTTDWVKYEIILNVPKESGTLNFGMLLQGAGKVWFDRVSFEIVGDLSDNNIANTGIPEKPSNIDFEE